jgi:uncharacterized protein (TIGR03032 family)
MENKFELNYSGNIPQILKDHNICVLLSTYQAGKVIILSSKNNELFQTPISFKKPMGIAIQGSKLAVACMDEIIFFSKNENIASFVNNENNSYDSVYIERASYNTSTLDIHDLEFGDGVIWGVNTLFSCLSIFDINFSHRPKWKPPFISKLVPEDRCHLNGIAFEDNIPKYVTALSDDDQYQGWRKNKLNTGILMEVPSGEIILSNLAMPHSPRFYNQELYLLESGTGNLIKVNVEEKNSEVVFNFNCFVRGLSFSNNFAFIGKSKIRENSTDFNQLEVKDNSLNAGLIIFCMNTLTIKGEINYTADVQELYDVQILEDTANAVIITKEIEEYRNIITFPGNVFKKLDSKTTPND